MKHDNYDKSDDNVFMNNHNNFSSVGISSVSTTNNITGAKKANITNTSNNTYANNTSFNNNSSTAKVKTGKKIVATNLNSTITNKKIK